MQDFVGVIGVISRERLAELSERSNGPAFIQLASHFGAIALNSVALWWSAGSWWCLPFFLLQGVLLNFLYAPEHECDHFTAFKSRRINVAVARICGFILVLTNEYHRWSHYHHHRNTQDWENDTEIKDRPVFNTPWQYLGGLLGYSSFWHSRVTVMFNHVMGRADEPYLTTPQRKAIITVARWHALGYVAVALSALWMQSWWPLYYWLGPYMLMRWTYWLQGIGEHTGLTHASNTLLNTRTIKTNVFMRWVNWNMVYHAVHHTFPSVPFYRLPQLHREVEAALGYELPSTSYLELHWEQLKMYGRGMTELDICEQHDQSMRNAGRL